MSVQKFAHKFTDKRETHLKRSLVIRIIYVVAGFAFFIPGLPLLFIFPEAGIPLVLFGLVFLSHEYIWAGRSLLWFSKVVDAVIKWYKNLPRVIRICIEVFFVVLTVWLIYLLVN
jgi:uncharacterized membrane protein